MLKQCTCGVADNFGESTVFEEKEEEESHIWQFVVSVFYSEPDKFNKIDHGHLLETK